MSQMTEAQMLGRIAEAQKRVKQILSQHKHPQLLSQIEHTYEDKYLLSELLCNVAVASQMATLVELGATEAQLREIKAWSADRAVSLVFHLKRHADSLWRCINNLKRHADSLWRCELSRCPSKFASLFA